MMPATITPEQARAALDHKGVSIAEFSRKHGLNKNLVSDLLNGRIKGRRGGTSRRRVTRYQRRRDWTVMASALREQQKMESQVLKTRREVVSAIICTFDGGRECAAARIGLPLKKFDNHAYENNNCRPLTDAQIFQLEQVTGTQHLPNYVAAMYGGMFVPVVHPENLDNVEMYARAIQSSAKHGTVDQAIAQALEDGVITDIEAELIQSAHVLHMAARTAEVYAAIDLYRAKSGKAK